MGTPGDARVSQVVARFFEERRSGRRASIDEVLAALPDLPDRVATRAGALRVIADQAKASYADPAEAVEGPLEFPALEGYDIIDRIGRGGMGVVYEAYQQSTGRRVAVKFMLERLRQPEAARR